MPAKHILPLTGLRLFAATWVASFHLQPTLNRLFPALNCLSPVTSIGYEAVPLFFLLSGFILSHNYFENYSLNQHHKFIFLRVARLWPVHITMLLFLITGPDIAILQDRQQLKEFFEEATMTRYWHHTDLQWNGPAWSISCEWLAYLTLFPLAFLIFRKIQSRILLTIVTAACLVIQAPFQGYLTGIKMPGRWPNIIFLFLGGSALYQLYRQTKNPPAQTITISALALMGLYIILPKELPVSLLYGAFALLIFGLAYEQGALAKMLSTKLAVLGGLASYSIYMTHYLVIRSFGCFFLNNVPTSLGLRLLILMAVIGAIGSLGWLVYRYIEEPANRNIRRFGGVVGSSSIKPGAVVGRTETAENIGSGLGSNMGLGPAPNRDAIKATED